MVTRIGTVLIAAGAAVWLVYGIAWLAGSEPTLGAFLPFHLAAVIPGAILSRWASIREAFARSG